MEWQDIFKVLKGKHLQPRLLYPARMSFKINGEIKRFSDKQKVREFSITKPALQQMLKGLIQSRNTGETPRHILIKLTKTKLKERKLNTTREKQQVTYKGNPICLTANLSAETLQARRECQDIFKVLKGKNLQSRLLYPARISFKIGGEIKSFSDKQKLREFSTTKPALQQILKGFIQSRNTREEKRATQLSGSI